MRNWKNALTGIALIAAAMACETMVPMDTYEIDMTVECSNCNSHPANANLRVMLRPASALVGDTLLTDQFVGWNEWILLGTGTDTIESAFREVEAGEYLITAVSPYPVQLGGACRTEGADTAIVMPQAFRKNPDLRPTGYGDSWPYVRVTVPNMVHVSPTPLAEGIKLTC